LAANAAPQRTDGTAAPQAAEPIAPRPIAQRPAEPKPLPPELPSVPKAEPARDESVVMEKERQASSQPQRMPPPQQAIGPTEEELEHHRSEREIRAALDAKNSRKALALLDSALARGLLGLGERDYALEHIMPAVVRDQSLSAADYLALLRQSGWSVLPRKSDFVSTTRRAAAARADAEIWYLGLARAAARNNWTLDRLGTHGQMARTHESEAARLLLRRRWSLQLAAVAPVARQMQLYDHHAPWIAHRFEPANIARVRRMLARRNWLGLNTAQGKRRRYWFVVVAGTILAAVFIAAAGVLGNPFFYFGAAWMVWWALRSLKQLRR
jgi:hypothetical protein